LGDYNSRVSKTCIESHGKYEEKETVEDSMVVGVFNADVDNINKYINEDNFHAL